MDRPVVVITAAMLATARRLEEEVRVDRTRMSVVDALGGIVGEFAFAQWLTGDWRNHEVGRNKGRADLLSAIEVKTSVFPFREDLNLVIREDYGAKYKPFYVQLIIDAGEKRIEPGTRAVLCGFASHAEATARPAAPMKMRGGGRTAYKTYTMPITRLHPMGELRDELTRMGIGFG